MAKSHGFLMVQVLVLLLGSTGCSSLSLTRYFRAPEKYFKSPERPSREVVPKRLIQADFSDAETAKMCLTAGRQMDAAGHAREAIAQYERARQLDPTLAGLSWRLGVLYGRLGDTTKSDAEFHKACDTYPANADLLNDHGYFLLQAGWVDQAESRLRAALEVDGNHPRARCNLAILLARQGRLQESYALFAATVGPAAAHHNLGVILAQQGRTAEAEQAFHQALAISPGMEQTRGLLAHVAGYTGSQSAESVPATRR